MRQIITELKQSSEIFEELLKEEEGRYNSFFGEYLLEVECPMGRTIILQKETFLRHIGGENGDHPERSYLGWFENFNLIIQTLTHPIYILEDKDFPNRLVYHRHGILHTDEKISGYTMQIIIEHWKDKYKIITIFPSRKVNGDFTGRVRYYEGNNKSILKKGWE